MSTAQDQLLKLLRPNQRIWVAGACNEPQTLLKVMRQTRLPEHLCFIQFPQPGYNTTDFTSWGNTIQQETFFMTPILQAADSTRLKFLPMHYRQIFDYLSKGVDVVLIQAARDVEGKMRLGPNVDFAEAALRSASTIIVELNSALTASLSCPIIDPSSIDHLVESNRPLNFGMPVSADATAARIAKNVSGLINDGDCIQTGIGAIPGAILRSLTAHNDLGIHGGLLDENGMELIKNGNVNGLRKSIDNSLHIVGMALGNSSMYDWVAKTSSVQLKGANYTHDIAVLSALNCFVSINSAVEVDLFGQVNAEFRRGKQISGTGGAVDFMRGARASKGGRSIVAMPATARRGEQSRIVSKVELVTAARTDIDYLVTEHGVATLHGASMEERKEQIISIAAPEYRQELRSDSR